MDRLLFRCVDTLVDCSELERQAFNSAFTQSGLDWHWSEDRFLSLLKIAGERHRISWFAEHILGDPITCPLADKVQWRKEQILHKLLQSTVAPPLPGVLRLLSEAADAQINAVAAVSSKAQHSILTQSANHYKYSSNLTVGNPAAYNTGTSLASIEIDLALNEEAVPQGYPLPCITVSSNVSKGHACITHFGECDNPAVQLSGTTILNQGSVSLKAMLEL